MPEHPTPAPPPDEAARQRIRTDLQKMLFVEAGAGSGKTTALVDRVVALVADGGVALDAIAAITFTEKAAAELRDRVRDRLAEAAEAAVAGGDAARAERCRRALDDLDGAAISTLHAFAQRILREHPIEAGLPPRLDVLDEVGSSVAFDQRWTRFLDALLDDPAVEDTLLLALAADLQVADLRVMAQVFGENWDLVATRVDPDPPEPDAAGLESMLEGLERAVELGRHCADDGDLLLERLDELAELVEEVRSAPDDASRLRLLAPNARPSGKVANKGRKGEWSCDINEVRSAVSAAVDEIDHWRSRIATACVVRLAASLRAFTLGAADERRRAGRLEFHDLLVLARQVLTDPEHGATVRRALHDLYQRLLLDEFQDTDPIQLDLAALIAGESPEMPAASWRDLTPAPGRLFFVGDPKQSIYRFRRADIALFLAARDRFGTPTVELTTNFRSTPPVIDWVNGVFGQLIAPEPGSQPEYRALHAVRDHPPHGPGVALLGSVAHADSPNAFTVREREAAEVVVAIRTALAERWSVRNDRDGGGDWRNPEYGDITVLLPTRLSLTILEDALDAAGIPYRAESSSLVYATRAVRDVMAAVRAIDDPTDQLSLITALRSPLFGCGDDDLFRWRMEATGSWSHQHPVPEGVDPDDVVATAMSYLAGLHRERQWLAPSEILDRLIRDRRVLEAGYAEGRPRDRWRRMRFVVDQARAWSEAEGGSLRDWLRWVRLQSEEGGRVAESVLPETDDDSVRIMTIHAAKGLEFPITIVSGLSTKPQAPPRRVHVTWPAEGSVAYRVGSTKTAAYEEFKPIDEQMDRHERLRLLYVACTRACDHLVVSLHRAETKGTGQPTNAALIAAAVAEMGTAGGTALMPTTKVAAAPPPLSTVVPLDDPLTWAAERDRRLAAGSRPRTVAATTLAKADDEIAADPGLDKRPRDLDLPPWNKGRYGSAVGRAVHAVLQTIDLTSGDGLAEAAAAQAAAEGVIGLESTIARLAGAALASPTVREATRHRFWREAYVAVPVGDTTLEGYLDLLYRTDDGLIIVDYKTAGGADADEIDRRVERYRLQGGAYALAAAEATGEHVARCVFVFLTDAGATERDLPDLPAAVEAVRARILNPAFSTT